MPKTQLYTRMVSLDRFKSSLFLFGPRMTGKSTLMNSIECSRYYNLLDPEEELRLKQSPKQFWEEISALKNGSVIIVDEIQRVPSLLDYIQMGIENLSQRFIMSGSSARKLKRGNANLLGGRALDLKLHSLTANELGNEFNINTALHFGTLPKVYQLSSQKNFEEAALILKSYYTTYIKEEIQAEALVRNIGAFQRFLAVAVQAHGTIIEYANISKDCNVPDNTVKEYFSILEETLLGEFLWQWDASERKKSRPKFYFFDCGVVRALQGGLTNSPLPRERGILFEGWFLRELIKLRDYLGKEHTFSYWRERDNEIDILVSNRRGIILAIECKSSESNFKETSLNAFNKKFPKVPIIVASLTDTNVRKLESGVEVLPWREAIKAYLGA